VAPAKSVVLDKQERDQVVSWRLTTLLAAGYERPDARKIAESLEVDLHAAVELVRRGCPHQTAVRILL
jgi:hypothetical protein